MPRLRQERGYRLPVFPCSDGGGDRQSQQTSISIRLSAHHEYARPFNLWAPIHSRGLTRNGRNSRKLPLSMLLIYPGRPADPRKSRAKKSREGKAACHCCFHFHEALCSASSLGFIPGPPCHVTFALLPQSCIAQQRHRRVGRRGSFILVFVSGSAAAGVTSMRGQEAIRITYFFHHSRPSEKEREGS